MSIKLITEKCVKKSVLKGVKECKRMLLKKFNFLLSTLQAEISFIDFAHVCSLTLFSTY